MASCGCEHDGNKLTGACGLHMQWLRDQIAHQASIRVQKHFACLGMTTDDAAAIIDLCATAFGEGLLTDDQVKIMRRIGHEMPQFLTGEFSYLPWKDGDWKG